VSLQIGGDAGVFQGNDVLSGTCADSRAVSEPTPDAHPRIFEDNHLMADVRVGFLYADSTVGGLVTPEAVDALTDTLASGTTAEICE
jgi:hypothetical protein